MDEKTIAARQIQEKERKADQVAAKRHQDTLDKLDALGQSQLDIMRSFVAYLNKRVSKTQLTNQLKSIATPDALKLIPLLNKIDKTVKDKAIDWKPVTDALQPITEALQLQASKKDPEPIKIPEIDYEKLTGAFTDAMENLAAPVVNVAAPIIKVPKADAPIINTEKVDLKPFVNEVLQVLTDFRVWTQDFEGPTVDMSEVTKLLEANNELLKKIEKKKFGGGGGGGGGGPVYKENASLGRASPLVYPELTEDGSVKTLESSGLVPARYDSIVLTYIGATDRIATATYKLAAATIATLTLGYDGSNRLNSVVKT